MSETTQERDDGATAQPGTGGATPASTAKTPAAEQADSQDKTKDKPDSGQNEDG